MQLEQNAIIQEDIFIFGKIIKALDSPGHHQLYICILYFCTTGAYLSVGGELSFINIKYFVLHLYIHISLHVYTKHYV